ncbi:ExeM/NucH family extracellular endonuclease [Thiohalomonas denitrificans]|uniref:ExeM/NucH family extracellular endonuclease n=1 Tax=Thiohalomonas denitrificans TaxID=415747 RepID=UPI0026E945E3|nr:ExeM/NucH family extracellular endonuclease [Thiohalomonas denitrificans]
MFKPALLALFLVAFAAGADCPSVDTTSIPAIKGYTAPRIPAGEEVTVEGIVSGSFLGGDRLGGFYLQARPSAEEDLTAGIFVYAPQPGKNARTKLVPGNHIQLTGRVKEYKGQIQLIRPKSILHCGEAKIPTSTVLHLPADEERLARLEGLRVRLAQPLTVSGNGDLLRYGSLDLSQGGRLFRPTQAPGIEGRKNASRRILLDDGSYRARPQPIPYLDADGTRRAGSRVDNIEGILAYAFGEYRVHPTEAPTFQATNPRPETPQAPNGRWRVAVFNVENYFTTLGSRGADNRREHKRQTGKLLEAIRALEADVLALAEIENREQSLQTLVTQLNRNAPPGARYHAVEPPRGSGHDAIRSALVYRADRLVVDRARSSLAPVHSRPPLAALFKPRRKGARPFGVIAIHFKSKSGCPKAGDVDRGQGCWNLRRMAQAEALIAFARTISRETGVDEWLVAGDVNAYGDEAPVRRLKKDGLTDLVAAHVPQDQRYTYVYRGESGYLDYALATSKLARRVRGVRIWHINADEPPFLAYDGEPDLLTDTPYRSSDHDPLVVDLADPQID